MWCLNKTRYWRIVWLMSSRVARDSLDPIREIQEAPLQRRRSWSRAIGRSTGIPRGSMSDHGCRLLARSLRISLIEEHRRSDREWWRSETVRDLRRLIRRLRSISHHLEQQPRTRWNTLALATKTLSPLFRDRSSSAVIRVAMFLSRRWSPSRQSRRSLTSLIDHHTAKDIHTANHLSFSHILRYHRRYLLSRFFGMLVKCVIPVDDQQISSPPRCLLASNVKRLAPCAIIGEAWCQEKRVDALGCCWR